MIKNKKDITWYHGSPHKLNQLDKGSTITPDKDLAKVFSHKPSIVSISDSGQIKHNGNKKGYLYIIDESIYSQDIYLHPDSTMKKGKEWLTTRKLKVRLNETVNIKQKNILSEKEINKIKNKFL